MERTNPFRHGPRFGPAVETVKFREDLWRAGPQGLVPDAACGGTGVCRSHDKPFDGHRTGTRLRPCARHVRNSSPVGVALAVSVPLTTLVDSRTFCSSVVRLGGDDHADQIDLALG